MVDFILIGDADERRLERLVAAVTGFEESPEYLAMEAADNRSPYLVAARAGEYRSRLAVENSASTLAVVAENIETLANDSDDSLIGLVVEVLNSFYGTSDVIITRVTLGPRTAQLLARYVRSHLD